MMRKSIMTAIAFFALTATPAIAQHGPPPGAGGGPGGGMGAGPPMTPPGQMGGGMGTSDFAHGIASQRGQFGRDFAVQQHLTPQQYQALARQHRAEALAIAQAARNGARLPANAGPRIREALKQDIDAWRDQFQVDRRSWQAMRDQWLASRRTMTAEQWAIQRANWFAARDAWIANQKAWANARRR
jgi:hypothetical protein